jgi:hypothetical protein
LHRSIADAPSVGVPTVVQGEGELPLWAVQVPGFTAQAVTPEASNTGFPATTRAGVTGFEVVTVPLNVQDIAVPVVITSGMPPPQLSTVI